MESATIEKRKMYVRRKINPSFFDEIGEREI